jgi:excisionase family DNA binding protein
MPPLSLALPVVTTPPPPDTSSFSGQLLNVTQVARRIGVSRSLVYNMIRQGRLIAFRISPRSVRIPESEIQRLLNDAAVVQHRLMAAKWNTAPATQAQSAT